MWNCPCPPEPGYLIISQGTEAMFLPCVVAMAGPMGSLPMIFSKTLAFLKRQSQSFKLRCDVPQWTTVTKEQMLGATTLAVALGLIAHLQDHQGRRKSQFVSPTLVFLAVTQRLIILIAALTLAHVNLSQTPTFTDVATSELLHRACPWIYIPQ